MGIFDAPQARAPYVPFLVLASSVAPIPLVSVLAQPGGIVERRLVPLLSFAESDLQRVAALAAFYVFMVYMFTAALSVTGQTLGNLEGYSNAEPRLGKDNLTGFAHRLTALHQNLLEIWPGFVICAAVTLALPSSASSSLRAKSLNYLTLHVFLKTCVYVPAYAAHMDTVRSITHLLAIGCLFGLLAGVATGY